MRTAKARHLLDKRVFPFAGSVTSVRQYAGREKLDEEIDLVSEYLKGAVWGERSDSALAGYRPPSTVKQIFVAEAEACVKNGIAPCLVKRGEIRRMPVLRSLPFVVIVCEFTLHALVKSVEARRKGRVESRCRQERPGDVDQAKPLVLFGKHLHVRHPHDAVSGTRNTTAIGKVKALASE